MLKFTSKKNMQKGFVWQILLHLKSNRLEIKRISKWDNSLKTSIVKKLLGHEVLIQEGCHRHKVFDG